MPISQRDAMLEEREAKKRGIAQGLVQGRKEGKLAGIRLAVDELRKWARGAYETGDEEQSKNLDDAADSLAGIADRLEEEG
jgi:predicted transposase YdaD